MIDKIVTRKLTMDDLEEIIRVENGAWEPDLRASEDTIKERFGENPNGFIGYFEDTGNGKALKGFIYFRRIAEFKHLRTWEQATKEPLDPNGLSAYIVNVSAHPKGEGIGTTMLATVDPILKSYGIESVALGSRDNTEHFYRKCGYQVLDYIADWWPKDEASYGRGVLMFKHLKREFH